MAHVIFEVHAPFGEIILAQPDKRNALNQAMWRALPTCIAAAQASDDVKVVIIHGGDAGAFASGADISEFATLYATPASAAEAGAVIAQALNAVAQCTKPVVAAIEGACVGGGVSLAMAADVRIAGKSARFGVTPGKLGLVYPAGDTRRLLAAIGPAKTKDLLMTGRMRDAADALHIGLIDYLCETGTAQAAARDWGRSVAAISQWSARATKQMIAGLAAGWADDAPAAEALFLAGFANADFAEGASAFLEKRSPEWKVK
jgi:enoyl-CoA hydratase/carnithine racemase